MKTRIIKIIRLLSLFLAVALMTAHMIIPHDHHQSDSVVCNQDSWPDSNQGTGHHSNLPIHCHAFNDLASEKAINPVLLNFFQFRDLKPVSIIDTALSYIPFSRIRVYNVFKDPVNAGILELSSLRAPPSLS